MSAPELEPHCGSWVAIDPATGKPFLETFNRVAADVYSQHVEILTAAQWLARYNRAVKLASGSEPTKAQLDFCRL